MYFEKVKSRISKILLFIIVLSNLSICCQTKKIDSIFTIYEDKAWEAIINQKDSGIYYSNKIIDFAKKNGNYSKEITGLEYRGSFKEEVLNDYEASIEDYLSAIKIAEKHKNEKSKYSLYSQIGILYIN